RNLGPELAPALRRLGYNATDVSTTKIHKQSDDCVLSTAWSGRRILLTQNRKFLNDQSYPPDTFAGIVVLPAHYHDALTNALVYVLSILGKGRELWQGTKISVGEDGRVTVTIRNHDTGASKSTHYKLRVAGPPLVWTSAERSQPLGSDA